MCVHLSDGMVPKGLSAKYARRQIYKCDTSITLLSMKGLRKEQKGLAHVNI